MKIEPELEALAISKAIDEMDQLRADNERLKGEVEKQNENCHQLTQQFESERRSRLGLSSKIGHLTSDLQLHKQALEVARVALSDAQTKLIEHHEYRVMRDEHSVCPVCTSKEGDAALNNISRSLTTINNVLKEGK